MLKYILRRILFLIPTLLIIITIIFFVIRLAPGGPFDAEKKIPEIIKQNLEKKYHLDESLIKQYFRYMADIIFKFDLGPSYSDRARSVNDLIAQKLPVSFTIGSLAILIAFIFGVTIGIISALKQNKFLDYFFMSFALVGISAPLFLIAPVFILLFARLLGLVPVAGWGSFGNLLVPVLALSLPYTAYISRLTKSGMLDIIRSDFITTARAKGLKERVIIVKHVLRGALIPVVSFLGPAFAGIITGSMVIEQICNIPGMGRDFVLAAFNRDYTLVAGVMITYSVLLLVLNLVVDILYAFMDPIVKNKGVMSGKK